MGKSKLDMEKRRKKNGEATNEVEAKPDQTTVVTGDAANEQGKAATEATVAAETRTVKAATKPKMPRGAKGRGKPRVAEDEETPKGAKKALRNALKSELKKERTKIARSLVKNFTAGDKLCTEFVLAMVEPKKKDSKDGKKKQDGPNEAEVMASEPEWDGTLEQLLRLAPRAN